ncbi:unnamed protein product [Clonostachys solani]|uniref:Uncharacterized protein n=1 Tax=Clonostachys solani TaxID=160281 RepID=A0A9N9YSF9_9HYPO|nr:unnamed protein product [Clonostachys solani]
MIERDICSGLAGPFTVLVRSVVHHFRGFPPTLGCGNNVPESPVGLFHYPNGHADLGLDPLEHGIFCLFGEEGIDLVVELARDLGKRMRGGVVRFRRDGAVGGRLGFGGRGDRVAAAAAANILYHGGVVCSSV